MHCPAKKNLTYSQKSEIQNFHWIVFGFDYGTHLLWHRLISSCSVTTFISGQSRIHFSPSSCTDDGRYRSLSDVFSSTTQRFSMVLRSGLCGSQSMCENDVSCSMNHCFAIWAQLMVALSSWISPCHQGRKSPLMEKPGYSVHSRSQSWQHVLGR